MQILSVKIREFLITLVLAAFLLFFVGFAPGIFHNAAHDLRHAFAVPCH